MRKKEKNELIILGVGIVTLVFLWMYVQKPAKNAPSIPPSYKPEKTITSPISSQRWNVRKKTDRTISAEKVEYTGRRHRDPLDSELLKQMSKTGEEREEAGALEKRFLVSAIIWGSELPQAIINGKIVSSGEALNGATIIGIDKKGVRINLEGKEVLLSIK